MEHVFLEIFEVVTLEPFLGDILPLSLQGLHLLRGEVDLPLIDQEQANLDTNEQLVVVLLLGCLVHDLASASLALVCWTLS